MVDGFFIRIKFIRLESQVILNDIEVINLKCSPIIKWPDIKCESHDVIRIEVLR